MSDVFATGLVPATSLATMMEQERAAAQEAQAKPLITGISGHIRQCWTEARDAKQQTVEERLLRNMRARRNEYDPEKLAAIKEMGGSEVYANLTSVKCRAATAWLRDVLMSTGSDRPWTIRPTPVAELDPTHNDQIVQSVAQELAKSMQSGQQVSDDQLREALDDARDEAMCEVQEAARTKANRMGDKMEDQMVEGGFLQAMDAFLEDIATFPSAVIKGPVVRKRKTLQWVKSGTGYEPKATDTLKLEWERVSPFNIYPSPAATGVDDGFLIEKHRLSREDLNALIGVDGYDDATIRMVLEDYGRGGLREWLTNDMAQASAEGKSTTHLSQNTEGLIDAIQFWGSVSGQHLLDWGMSEKEIQQPSDEYHVEAWLIGTMVIKAVLNYDPLCRKPYYKASYEDIPGTWWGSSVADLVRDSQTVMNATARAIVNNVGIASGPQVVVNTDRLAPGEDITTLRPWRIWQVINDPSGSNSTPIEFFQPDSRIAELITVFQRFQDMADEYSGLPKYMDGDAGGAGRTASGLSMLMSNAGKTIKQVVANIDIGVMTPLLERLYNHNMQFSDDDSLKGDIQIEARGASSLVQKEAAQQRRNEFLAATANPIDMQIVGVEGRAAILRETAKTLDMDPDEVVPSVTQLKAKMLATQMMQQAQNAPPGGPPPGGPPNMGTPPAMGSGQTLADSTPTTDTFSPSQ